MPAKKKDFGSPNMSDTTLLVSVEDLINMAMGPTDKNIVNFKLIQTVLHILARQMRMLEQRVEIRITDERERGPSPPRRMEDISEERKSRSPEKGKREDKYDRKLSKEREKAEKSALKDKVRADRAASKERDKAERAVSKEREKAEKADAKEKERAERDASKERGKAEREAEKGDRAASKEREKAEKAAAKEKEKEERGASKEREKAEKAAAKDKDKSERAASKEREKAEKAADKGDKAASKDREKAEKAAAKEKEKEDKAAAKASGKADKEKEKPEKADAKEREKAEKAGAKEREKEEKASAKDKEKADKAGAKEREKAEKEAVKEKETKKGKKGRAASDTSIVVSEVERRKEKVLVVEKGPTTRADKGREGIEVVTRSQFDIVEALVKDLQKRAAPLPAPALPDNERLRQDLAKGQASLTDTMQAMQVTARVRAAEQAIGRMGDLLTQLAAAGALPEDMADQIGEVKFEPPDANAETTAALPSKSKSTVSRKSVAIDPMAAASEATMGPRASTITASSRGSLAAKRASTTSRASMASASMPPVTHPELDDAIRSLRDDFQKNMTMMTAKATAVAENASASAKAVSDKLDIALKLDTRISTLYSLTSDYAEQLSGFDSGLTTQMMSFRDQMGQMRTELQAGLKQLEQVNNNAETAAVMELTERYDGLVTELDHTLHAHRTLTTFQKQLGDELHSLVECVEMLREQKADRDEVLDGLRDKADNTRLAGLLTAVEFAAARHELEKRLDVCHDKFRRQESVWMTALKDLKNVTENKAEITQLLAAREQAEMMLRELQDKQMKLAVILGEPKAAMLTRALARGASCGACLAPALMEPRDRSYGAPPRLPALRARPGGADEPCEPAWEPPEPPDHREHTCHRWVGGSHTLLSDAVTRERAPPVQLQATPTKKYTGYGDDGRLYMLEEELQPCVECNKFSEPTPEAAPEQGAGDLGPPPPPTE